MLSTITSKGQVTLPNKLRKQLNLHSGDKLEFIYNRNGSFTAYPISGSISNLLGILKKPKRVISLEEMDEAIIKGSSN